MPATFRATLSPSTRRRRAAWIIALALLLALSACARGGAFSGRRQPQAATTATPTPARTIPPTYTPAPAVPVAPATLVAPTPAVPAADATITQAAPTLVTTPTPDPVLSQVKLVGLSWLEKYRYNLLLSFDFPAPVDPADYRVTLEDKPYRCEILAQYPNRLYCNGQGAKVLTTARVQIYAAGAEQPGFETEVWVPYFQ